MPSRPARSKSVTLAFRSFQVGEVFFGLTVTIVLQIVAPRRYSGMRFSSNWYDLSRLPNFGVDGQRKGLPSSDVDCQLTRSQWGSRSLQCREANHVSIKMEVGDRPTSG